MERPIYTAETVLAVAHEGGEQPPSLIVGLWGDGTTIFSSDWLRGGGLYYRARFDLKRMKAFLDSLEKERFLGDRSLEVPHIQPNADHLTIVVRYHKKGLVLRSWHDFPESSGRSVVTPRGVELLNGRRRDDVLALQSPDYQRFRKLWDRIRRESGQLAPRRGERTTGTLKRSAGALFWEESAR